VYGFIIPPWGELRNLAAVNKWFLNLSDKEKSARGAS
jgi:hypothetical protein